MRIIIKQMTLLLLLFVMVLSFVGCGDTISDTTPADTTPADTTSSGANKSGEFVVLGTEYVYKNKDVVLLNVENQTDKDYDVTAVVHYFDAEGYEIKTQKQTFTGWASGCQNYFLFQPNITFDTFTYTLELEEVDEKECYLKYIDATFVGLKEKRGFVDAWVQQGNYTKAPYVSAGFKLENKAQSMLKVAGAYVVIDKNGDIYYIRTFNQNSISPQKENYDSVDVYYNLTSDTLVWPEELVGDVKGIYVITRVWQ